MHSSFVRRLAGAAALLLALPAARVAAQAYTITGSVVDAATQRPLPNVTVTLRGTSARALTASSGQFSLSATVSPGGYTLLFNALGRAPATRQVTLGADRAVQLQAVGLQETALELEGLIVTGQGAPVERRRIGNTVATIRGDEVNEAPAAISVDRALQGRIPGAVISQNSGSPGAGTSINLRGTSSVLGGNEPLIVVDGVIIENGSEPLVSLGSNNTRPGSAVGNRLNDLAPGDIERIEVLKGAAAAALYGSRANNGVIQIFTKRGSGGAPRLSYTMEATTSRTPAQYEVMDLERAGPGDSVYVTKADGTRYRIGETLTRYNIQDQIFRTAGGMNQQISLSGGGGEGLRYYLSGSWLDQQGIIRSTGQEKRTVRGSVTQRLSPLVELSVNGSYIRNETSFQPEGEQTQGALTIALFTPTSFNYAFDQTLGRYPYTPIITANPLQVLRDIQADANVDRFIGSFQATLTPLPQLTINALAGIDDSREENVFLQPPYSTSSTFTGSISNPVRSVRKWNTDLTATYEAALGGVGLTTTGGFRYTADRINTIRAGAEGLPPSQGTVGGATQFASQAITELRTAGGYLQERLAFGEKLFVTGAVNVEGSSAFGSDVRYQSFPRLGFSWVVDEMPFWDGMTFGGRVSSLRVRGSYGETGGQPPSAYLTTNNFVDALFGGRPGQVGSTTLANPELRPERQREFEGGFDVGLLDDRVSLEFTYYDQLTRDLVLLVPLPISSGFNEQYQNIGEISNRGMELSLGADIIRRGSFDWNARLSYARNRNRVERLRTSGDTILSEYLNVVTEGQPVGVFYGAVYPRDADGNIVLFNGRPRRDRECPAAGCTTAADSVILRRIIGDPNPDFTASLSNNFTFGQRLQVSMLLDGRFGNDVANFTRRIQDYFGVSAQTEQEATGEVPVGYYFLNAERHVLYEAFVEDGSFIKLREVSLAYNLADQWARRVGAESVQLRLAGRNLHTWTDYSGVDPEINLFGGSTIARGVDFVTTPIPRTFSVGLNLNF